jgi:hypothetical protein
MNDQFKSLSNDLFTRTVDDTDMVAMIAAICAIERTNPGTLSVVFRLVALAGSDFKFRFRTNNPEKSIEAQKELDQFLQDLTRSEYHSVSLNVLK